MNRMKVITDDFNSKRFGIVTLSLDTGCNRVFSTLFWVEMKKIIIKIYSFIFSFYKQKYYKDKDVFNHDQTKIMVIALFSFPIVGLLIHYNLPITLCHDCNPLMSKVSAIPIVAVYLILMFYLFKKLGFNRYKEEIESVNFQDYSFKEKIYFCFAIFTFISSLVWLPILMDVLSK